MGLSFWLLIAQQGLNVAASMLRNAADSNTAKAKQSTDPNIAAKLSHAAEQETNLANILFACETGITAYLAHQ